MNYLHSKKVVASFLLLLSSTIFSQLVLGSEAQLSGKTQFEITTYANEGQFEKQDYRANTSLALEPELYWDWNNGDDSFIFTPFFRIDQQDDERTHGDIRELSWTHVNNEWEFHTGIRKVFWGVTEFNHLVDVINQTDGVESFDGEEKLGQPMLAVSKVNDWGIVDAYVLLGFREQTFAGEEGRLRSQLIVDTNRASYESSNKEEHIDFALRWSHSFSVFDFGLYWFDGTDRNPILNPQSLNGNMNINTVLAPYYQQMSQAGVDLQATIDSWLWKFEGINKDTKTENYSASQAGFEYTFYGISESALDLGILLEYGWDERNKNATSIAQNDIYLGARLTLNDEDDSTLLAGISYDNDYHTRSLFIEASKRLNDRWTIALEGLLFKASNNSDPASALNQDDRLLLTLERFF